MTTNILFVCKHNSARSILAEGALNHWAHRFSKDVRAFSAGNAPRDVNACAPGALREAGIEPRSLRSKHWNEFATPSAPRMHAVITVCDKAAADASLELPGQPVRVHWDCEDPSDAPAAARARAFEQTCQSMSDRTMQLVELPFENMTDEELERSLRTIGRT